MLIERTSNADLERIFVKLGIKCGDLVMLHADLRMFGLLEDTGRDFVAILKRCVGSDGCLITPSFTFSFPGVFDVRESQTTTGALSKLFRADCDVVRVPDGMTSYYIIGKLSNELIANWGHSSYGQNSIPDQLVKRQAKVLQLGTDILSLVHYLEEYVGVPYREVKRFCGLIKDGEHQFESYTDLYVRREPVKKLIPDPLRVGYFNEIAHSVIFKNRVCRYFDASDFVEYGRPILEANKRILIEE